MRDNRAHLVLRSGSELLRQDGLDVGHAVLAHQHLGDVLGGDTLGGEVGLLRYCHTRGR